MKLALTQFIAMEENTCEPAQIDVTRYPPDALKGYPADVLKKGKAKKKQKSKGQGRMSGAHFGGGGGGGKHASNQLHGVDLPMQTWVKQTEKAWDCAVALTGVVSWQLWCIECIGTLNTMNENLLEQDLVCPECFCPSTDPEDAAEADEDTEGDLDAYLEPDIERFNDFAPLWYDVIVLATDCGLYERRLRGKLRHC